MPQVFKIGSYWVYFWANEGEPREPVYVHVSQGSPQQNATKIWITKAGKCLLANNNSNIPNVALRNMMRIIEAQKRDYLESKKYLALRKAGRYNKSDTIIMKCREVLI